MTDRQLPARTWAVLLAGGDGNRLQSLTAMIEGDTRPKQFCRVLGDESLLSQTRRRIRPLFGPEKSIALVTRKHHEFYSQELNDLPQTSVIAQPENRGTGIAIALAIVKLRELDPDAILVAFPCDHHYSDEAAFLGVITAGTERAGRKTDEIFLIGAEATYPELDYGWIEPDNATKSESARVRRFWEKPTLSVANVLRHRGCLWNTFVMIGRVSAFIDVLCETIPNEVLALSEGFLNNNLDSVYRSIRCIDFSRDVLARHPGRLQVIRDFKSGWTDLGSPRRVFETLTREGIAPAWLKLNCDFGVGQSVLATDEVFHDRVDGR